MNWPNRLTIFRVMLIPLCATFILLNTPQYSFWALLTFCLASLTDAVDGWMARRNKLVTVFGKFLDPIADKLLVLITMVSLIGIERFPVWVGILVLFRELMVDGLRLIAVERGMVISASKLGKLKTISQMFCLIGYLVSLFMSIPDVILLILLLATVAMTVISGVDYFYKNRALFSDISTAKNNKSTASDVICAYAKNGKTIATAESLTAGLISSTLAEVSGASKVLMGGIVSYDERIKHDCLGVSNEIIDGVGVVSEDCAKMMARGCRERMKVDVAISATGLAGPTGGSEALPVGTVFLGISTVHGEEVKKLSLKGDRQSIREQTTEIALDWLCHILGHL